MNDKRREVERELDEFAEAIENSTEREKQLDERCRKSPLQVRCMLTSPDAADRLLSSQLDSAKATLSKSNIFTH